MYPMIVQQDKGDDEEKKRNSEGPREEKTEVPSRIRGKDNEE